MTPDFDKYAEGLELLMAEANIPDHMHGAISRYIVDGIPPGSFLTALMANDLVETLGRADYMNKGLVPNYVEWFYQHAPSPCWGSYSRVNEWQKRGGARGIQKERDSNEKAPS